MATLLIASALMAIAPIADEPAMVVTAQEQAAQDANPAQKIAAAMDLVAQGETEAAEAILDDVASATERYRVETTDGEWVDSRHLAYRLLIAVRSAERGGRLLAAR